MLLEASHVSKSYGVQDVLQDVSFRLSDGEKVGLVGRNGCGKTTLLRILAGEETPDAGHVRRVPSSLIVGYLPQAARIEDNCPVYEEIASTGIGRDRWWEAEKVLVGLGFTPQQLTLSVASLSGGEKTRLALAKLLLIQPDVLLLDEPTNHLDVVMLEWLEEWLKGFHGAAIIVSHDRRFLDNVVSRILELEEGKLTAYTGNYSDYARQKELALHRHEEAYRTQQREIQGVQEFIQRQLRLAARIESGPKRGRDHYTRIAGKVARRAQAGRKRLEQMERVEKPRPEEHIRFSFDDATDSGREVIVAENLSKQYGSRKLFTGLNLYVRYGDRLAIVGRNGAGKTTLLRILLGLEQPDTGTVRIGSRVQPGYLAQEHENLNPHRTVLDEVRSASNATQHEVRALLASLLFPGHDVFKLIKNLSEGERVRVALAKLLVCGANLLVLDEPTNHLDIATRERVEAALDAYTGTLLLVSHDRYLLDRLTEQTLVLEYGEATLYPGNYSYVAEKRAGRTDRVDELLRQMEVARLGYENAQASHHEP